MEDAGVLVESMSSQTSMIGGGVIGFLACLILMYVATKIGGDKPGLFELIAIIPLSAFAIMGGATLGHAAERENYYQEVLSEVEAHYEASLFSDQGADIRGIDLLGSGHIPVHFRHEGSLYTEAWLDKIDEGENMRYILMFDTGAGAADMTEFDPELVEEGAESGAEELSG